MAVRVGRWDCDTCGHKGNLGPETRCINCGAPRPKNVKFYLPTDAEIINDEVRLRAAKAGADWICGHCTGHNKVTDEICHACGNPKDETSEDVDLQVREYEMSEIPIEGRKKSEEAGERYRAARKLKQEKPYEKFNVITKYGFIGFILFLLVGYVLLSSFPKSIEVEVSGFRWERSIQFERYEAVAKEDWNTPSNAFDVSSFRAIHHYNKVSRGFETRTRQVQVKVGEERYVCGQRDLGNGYFEDKYCTRPVYENRTEKYREEVFENVPVYQTKYRFKVMEWNRKNEYSRKTAAKDHTPQWPDLPGSENEWRAGPRGQAYYVSVRESSGKSHEEKVGYNFWESLEKGEKLPAAKMRLIGTFKGITHPDKNR